MARNKYPEQTVDNILSVATKLFSEKGYDKTSVQDIINDLGMSKGAIYHHFKSKEEILDAVMERHFEETTIILRNMLNENKDLNAKERLIKFFEFIAKSSNVRAMDDTVNTQIKNPQFIVTGLNKTVTEAAPLIAEIIAEGEKDGSISGEFATEISEVLMLLLNIWLNPIIFQRNSEETIKRAKVLQYIMKKLGVDIISDSMIQSLVDIYSNVGGYGDDK